MTFLGAARPSRRSGLAIGPARRSRRPCGDAALVGSRRFPCLSGWSAEYARERAACPGRGKGGACQIDEEGADIVSAAGRVAMASCPRLRKAPEVWRARRDSRRARTTTDRLAIGRGPVRSGDQTDEPARDGHFLPFRVPGQPLPVVTDQIQREDDGRLNHVWSWHGPATGVRSRATRPLLGTPILAVGDLRPHLALSIGQPKDRSSVWTPLGVVAQRFEGSIKPDEEQDP